MNITAIGKIGIEKCSSCFICHDACARKAIEFKLDYEGFYKPFVNTEVCNNCGICSKVCPILNDSRKEAAYSSPIIYGGWNKDTEIRIKSSSGGLFFEIAKRFIEDGGVVCGVKWEKGVPVFNTASDLDTLKEFIGSKYLQANAANIYKNVKNIIKQGKKVLFTGVPCQVQGICNYINSSLLYTIDLVCAGVPSMKMYNMYCKEKYAGKDVTHVSFRCKNLNDTTKTFSNWRKYSLEFYSNEYFLSAEPHFRNPFFFAFNSTKCYNKACYECSFNTIPRRGNITLCDYWGAKGSMDQEEGVSLLLINDGHGQELFDNIINDNIFLKEIKDDTVYTGTKRLNLPNRECPKEREAIFASLENDGFNKMFKKYFKEYTLKGRIIRKLKNIFKQGCR